MIVSLLVAAALASQLADCRAITDDSRRLACYDALAAPPADANFGASTVPREAPKDEPKQIDAHLTERISGWRKGTTFALDNGQVWQSIDPEGNDETLDRPAVSIRRNFFGHYWMDVAGSGKSIQVTRIK